MRWFKHITKARRDEKMIELRARTGLEGMGFYWTLIEMVAEEIGTDDKCELTYPLQEWARLIGCHPNQFKKHLSTLQVLGLVLVEYPESDLGVRIRVRVSNLLKYRDEYSKKSGHRQENIQSKEREGEAETHTEKKNISPPAPAGDRHSANGLPKTAEVVLVPPAEVSAPQQQPGKLFEMQIRQPVAQVTVLQGSMTANGSVPTIPLAPIPESPPPSPPKKSKAQREREEFLAWLKDRYDNDLYPNFWIGDGRSDGWKAIQRQVREKTLRTRDDWYALMAAFERARPEQEAREKRFKKTIGPWINKTPWLDLPDKPTPHPSDERDYPEVPEL